jgi:hypothetical protein
MANVELASNLVFENRSVQLCPKDLRADICRELFKEDEINVKWLQYVLINGPSGVIGR